jgi:hypothetical protein
VAVAEDNRLIALNFLVTAIADVVAPFLGRGRRAIAMNDAQIQAIALVKRRTPTAPDVAGTYAFLVAVDSNVYRRSGWSCWFREVRQPAERFDCKAAHNIGTIACFAEQGRNHPIPTRKDDADTVL